jgi:hypothetical protein
VAKSAARINCDARRREWPRRFSPVENNATRLHSTNADIDSFAESLDIVAGLPSRLLVWRITSNRKRTLWRKRQRRKKQRRRRSSFLHRLGWSRPPGPITRKRSAQRATVGLRRIGHSSHRQIIRMRPSGRRLSANRLSANRHPIQP